MKEAGNAVMRSGWDADDSYVLFQAENGMVRTSGYGHEHPDGLNFILYAFGKSLAIDSGYINWENHDLVRYAKNHNVILVDNKGPEPGLYTAGGVDAFFNDFMTTSFMDFSSAWTEFSGLRHTRSLVFPDKRYLVVSDDIGSKSILSHTYNWLLHGNGGGSTGGSFSQEAYGGIWHNGNAELKAVVVSPEGSPGLSNHEDYHGFTWGVKETHSVLQADIKARRARYLAVLYPSDVSMPEPEIAPQHAPDGAAIAVMEPGSTTLVRTQSAAKLRNAWVLNEIDGHPEFPSVGSDAGLALISADSMGAVKQIFIQDASCLSIGTTEIIRADSRIGLALSIGTGIIRGHVIAQDGCYIDMFTGTAPLSVEGSTITGYSSSADGITRIIFSGQEDFTIYLSGDSIFERIIPGKALLSVQ
jgi:hypothetical protein